ncbi:unnamed protein product [Pleuronectes platessa]|uniref:Uncharacterized protein n=1 Tax=Pleuronectes platessa TaxID=8262 RepID=A0A9N7TN42_PLEPL|nr:unnamed protein product [Pleuronectes platessa]
MELLNRLLLGDPLCRARETKQAEEKRFLRLLKMHRSDSRSSELMTAPAEKGQLSRGALCDHIIKEPELHPRPLHRSPLSDGSRCQNTERLTVARPKPPILHETDVKKSELAQNQVTQAFDSRCLVLNSGVWLPGGAAVPPMWSQPDSHIRHDSPSDLCVPVSDHKPHEAVHEGRAAECNWSLKSKAS